MSPRRCPCRSASLVSNQEEAETVQELAGRTLPKREVMKDTGRLTPVAEGRGPRTLVTKHDAQGPVGDTTVLAMGLV